MQKDVLQNKLSNEETTVKELREFTFPKEWVTIKAESLEKALEQLNLLYPKETK